MKAVAWSRRALRLPLDTRSLAAELVGLMSTVTPQTEWQTDMKNGIVGIGLLMPSLNGVGGLITNVVSIRKTRRL
jgi:hypothetical protein